MDIRRPLIYRLQALPAQRFCKWPRVAKQTNTIQEKDSALGWWQPYRFQNQNLDATVASFISKHSAP
jgi:hypothetical protein